MLITFTSGSFPFEYIPTVFEGYSAYLTLNGQSVLISLWDTAGHEEYDKLRPLSYSNTNVFLCTFSIDNPSSFEHVLTKWSPEISHHCPNTPFLLVGTKRDLREDSETLRKLEAKQQAPISWDQGVEMAQKIKAVQYIECSSITLWGVKQLFEEAAKISLSLTAPKEKENKKDNNNCVIF
uniref:Uncharacterized protein n=1 Tax=Arcella intermedia TaxID=1963864 RepID=A0A6B2LKC0_9EUKA